MPNFGLNISDIKKLTDDKIELIKGRYEQALSWIVDIGKARSITVYTEKQTGSIDRVNVRVLAIEADGTPVSYDTFKSVGGAEDGFAI
jgi:phage gp46-like protein